MDVLALRVNKDEERVSDTEDKLMERKVKVKREKQLISQEERFCKISAATKCTNIRIIGVPEGGEGEGQKMYLSTP